jgi:hypothetical protein
MGYCAYCDISDIKVFCLFHSHPKHLFNHLFNLSQVSLLKINTLLCPQEKTLTKMHGKTNLDHLPLALIWILNIGLFMRQLSIIDFSTVKNKWK